MRNAYFRAYNTRTRCATPGPARKEKVQEAPEEAEVNQLARKMTVRTAGIADQVKDFERKKNRVSILLTD